MELVTEESHGDKLNRATNQKFIGGLVAEFGIDIDTPCTLATMDICDDNLLGEMVAFGVDTNFPH